MEERNPKNNAINIVITGASRGIGAAVAKQFASVSNVHLLLLARDKAALEMVQDECLKAFAAAKITALACDLTEEHSFEKIATFVKSNFEHLDILINNAGSLVNKPFAEITGSDIDIVFASNFKAPFKLIQTLLPNLKLSKQAHVINVGSIGGMQGSSKFAGLSAYSSSKGALSILTECLAEELAAYNIKVNCLALGAVNTAMLAEAFPGYVAPVNADEMAEFICNFAFHGHKVMNGKIVPVSLSNP